MKQFEFISDDQQIVKGNFVDAIVAQIRQLSFSIPYAAISGLMAKNANGWYGIIDTIEANQ